MSLNNHPTVVALAEKRAKIARAAPPRLDREWLRAVCLEAGADDVGFVEIDRPALAGERADMTRLLPGVRSAIGIVVRMHREAIRSPARSVANAEFHRTGHDVGVVARHVVRALEDSGVRAIDANVGFPMEVEADKMWVVSHKPIAVEAGLGRMGIHRNVIHPRFGNFVLLGTILLDRPISGYDAPLDYNPCLSCKLCVAACPVGAIQPDGHFDFSACLTHNYREFLNGFSDFVGELADSKSRADFESRVTDSETLSMWQSLSFGANYKAAYCLAACPAGEEVIAPFLDDRSGFLASVVKPLQEKVEPVYVVKGSDAERHVTRRFPHKRLRVVRNGARARSIRGFLFALPHLYQRGAGKGISARYHFVFTGPGGASATVELGGDRAVVHDELAGVPDLRVEADAASWLDFLAKRKSLFRLLVTGKLKLRGKLKLLPAFGRCFPS